MIRRLLGLVAALVTGVLLGAGGYVIAHGPGSARTDSPLLAHPLCGEDLTPDAATPIRTVTSSVAARTPIRDRRVELRAQRHPRHGWIVWASLTRSTSDLDKLWIDWSYAADPANDPQWRNCGQPVTAGSETPALKAVDDRGRKRWSRACGQVPPVDRGPRASGVFCTDWDRPQ